MTLSPISQKIVNAFSKYVETGDKSSIALFKLDEIEFALIQYSKDKGWDHYEAMEKRVAELKGNKQREDQAKTKWRDRTITFVFGLLSGAILMFLKTWIDMTK